jgi:DNA primase
MRFPPQFLDELRARLPVSEVVGRRVKLKKAGREFKGLSPFNKERTPSFFVNDAKAMWFDFSSGKNGNIFDFVMATEGVSFPEAVERLASQAGMEVPRLTREAEQREEKRKTLHDVMELAAKFFETALAARAGARARGYLADRGIAPALQLKFRLGYAPAERFALKEHLGAQGVPVEDMVEAGLLVSGEDIPVPFDRFRERIMFPITDLRGRVIAFGGRALEKDVPAKYLNSPETPLFHKGATLYNIASARAATHQGAPLIAVEGYIDVIAMVAAGYEATVAPLGTALTEDQLGLMWKMADEPALCFDGDAAGRRAAYRTLDIALPLLRPGKSLKFAALPEGQDPDDLFRSGGRAAIEEVLALAQPLSSLLWARETEGIQFETPERRAALEARIGEITAQVRDEAVRKYYRQDFGGRLRQMFEPAREARQYQRGTRDFATGRNGYRDKRRPTFAAQSPGARRQYVADSPQLATSPVHRGHTSMIPRREALILQAVLNHPWLLQEHMEELAAIEFRHADAQRMKSALIDICAHGAAEREAIGGELDARGFADLVERIARAITTPSVWGANSGAHAEDVLMTWKQLVALHRQWHSLVKELKDAEHALGLDNSEENYSWLRDVKARLSDIDGTEALIEGFGLASGRMVRSL